MIAHPNAQAIASVRAIQDRMESHTKTVVCYWCALVMDQGPEGAPLSHAVCDHKDCQYLSTEAYGAITIEGLSRESRFAYARWIDASPEHAPAKHYEFLRAETRFRKALAKLVEDRRAGR